MSVVLNFSNNSTKAGKSQMSEIDQNYKLLDYVSDRKILLETSREKLCRFAEQMRNNPQYIQKSSFKSKQESWDAATQSKLIESFLLNIPVPPIVLYEISPTSFELLDGQQRITAIRNFYEDKLRMTDFRDKLTGEEWFVKVEDTGIKPVKLQGLDNTYLVPDHIVVTVKNKKEARVKIKFFKENKKCQFCQQFI